MTFTEGSDLSAQFPLPWVIAALFRPDDEECGASSRIEIDIKGSPIAIPRNAGTYRVEFFGRGAEGDGSWAFELVTTEPGTIPPLTAQVSWHPAADSLDPAAPFTFFLRNTPGDPKVASADMRVVAADGTAEDFQLNLATEEACGSELAFDGHPVLTTNVMDLGPAPYEISLTAIVDGATITTDPVVWPNDFPENSNESVSVGAALAVP